MAKQAEVLGVKPKVEITERAKTEAYAEFFTLVTQNKITRIACGNAIVSRQNFSSVAAAKKYIDLKPWELIINVTCYIMDKTNEQRTLKTSK